ncbi:MAG: lysylphosphatidylglycerol synthase transmembrane domain-containing protein [Myxococcota bacterium]
MGVGLLVTAVFLWLFLRDVPFREVAHVIAGTRWGVLLGLSIPAYVLAVYLRALRWRHLTDPIQSISTGPLFRAVAIGFMANNIFPLRMGEVARCWYLARETGANTAAIFGTVVLERALDIVTVVALALGAFAVWGGEGEGVIARGAVWLLPAAAVPILVLAGLRAAPERVIAAALWALAPLPVRVSRFAERLLRGFSEGLGALRGGRHLFWIAFHSLSIWLVASTIPLLAGFLALGIRFDSPLETLGAAWITLAAIGVAVALPSAPGFFGAYHFACKVALERFQVPTETAVAMGTLAHATFWITLTVLGLVVLRIRRTSLEAIDPAAGGSEGTPPL